MNRCRRRRPFPDGCTSQFKTNLLTFTNRCSPHSTAIAWADAGFICIQQPDAILLCEGCGLKVKDIERDIAPDALHRAFSSNSRCPFLRLQAIREDSIIRGRDSGTADVLTVVPESYSANLSEVTAHHGNSDLAKRYQHFYRAAARKCLNQVASLREKPRSPHDWTFECNRKRSFENIHSRFSATEKRNLSAQGMYLDTSGEVEETLKCAFCDFSKRLSGEETFSTLSRSHRKSLSVCPWLAGFPCHNKPDVLDSFDAEFSTELPGLSPLSSSELQSFGINAELPKESEFANFEKRKSTYLTLPYNGFSLDVEAWCDAGLYYAGNGKLVCFFCKVETEGWEASEDPMERHARQAPSCQFLIATKGQDYVANVLDRLGEYSTSPEGDRIHRVDTRMLKPRLDSRVVQIAASMGIDLQSVRTVLIRAIKKGDRDFRYVADLVRAVQELTTPQVVPDSEEDVPDLLSMAAFQPNGEETQMEAENASLAASADASSITEFNTAAFSSHDTQLSAESPSQGTSELNPPAGEEPAAGDDNSNDLASTAKSLKSTLTCSVCLEEMVEVVFLPCGHLVCCLGCSSAMVHCPLCRVQITATVRAHL